MLGTPIPMDAKNAPTGIWKTAQNAVSHSAHTHHLLVYEEERRKTKPALTNLSTDSDQVHSRDWMRSVHRKVSWLKCWALATLEWTSMDPSDFTIAIYLNQASVFDLLAIMRTAWLKCPPSRPQRVLMEAGVRAPLSDLFRRWYEIRQNRNF